MLNPNASGFCPARPCARRVYGIRFAACFPWGASSMRFVAFYGAVYRNRQLSAVDNRLSQLKLFDGVATGTRHGNRLLLGTDAAHA